MCSTTRRDRDRTFGRDSIDGDIQVESRCGRADDRLEIEIAIRDVHAPGCRRGAAGAARRPDRLGRQQVGRDGVAAEGVDAEHVELLRPPFPKLALERQPRVASGHLDLSPGQSLRYVNRFVRTERERR